MEGLPRYGEGAARARRRGSSATPTRASSDASEIAAPSRTPGGVNVHVTRRAPAGTSTARRSPSLRARRGMPVDAHRPARVDEVGDHQPPRPGRRDHDAIGLARDDARGLRRAAGAHEARERQRRVVARDHAQPVAVDDGQTRRLLRPAATRSSAPPASAAAASPGAAPARSAGRRARPPLEASMRRW